MVWEGHVHVLLWLPCIHKHKRSAIGTYAHAVSAAQVPADNHHRQIVITADQVHGIVTIHRYLAQALIDHVPGRLGRRFVVHYNLYVGHRTFNLSSGWAGKSVGDRSQVIFSAAGNASRLSAPDGRFNPARFDKLTSDTMSGQVGGCDCGRRASGASA